MSLSLRDLVTLAKDNYELMENNRWVKLQSKTYIFNTLLALQEDDQALAQAIKEAFNTLATSDPHNTHQLTNWFEALNIAAEIFLKITSPANAEEKINALADTFSGPTNHLKFFMALQRYSHESAQRILRDDLQARACADINALMTRLKQQIHEKNAVQEQAYQSRQDISTLMAKLKLQEEKRNMLKEALTILDINNSQIYDELDAQDKQITTLLDGQDDLMTQMSALKEVIKHQNMFCDAQREVITELKAKLKTVNVEHQRINANLHTYWDGRERELLQRINDLDNDNVLYKTVMAETKQDHYQQSQASAKHIDTLQSAFNDLQQNFTRLKEQYSSVFQENLNLRNVTNCQKKTIGEIATRVNDNEKTIAAQSEALAIRALGTFAVPVRHNVETQTLAPARSVHSMTLRSKH